MFTLLRFLKRSRNWSAGCGLVRAKVIPRITLLDTLSFALATLLEAKVRPLIIQIQFQGVFVTLRYVQNWVMVRFSVPNSYTSYRPNKLPLLATWCETFTQWLRLRRTVNVFTASRKHSPKTIFTAMIKYFMRLTGCCSFVERWLRLKVTLL